MSDDEEIVFQSSDLGKHLVDQGYSDFTTYNSSYNKGLTNVLQANDDTNYTTTRFENTEDSTKCYNMNTVSVGDHNKILNVLNSQLLFKEDIDILETIVSSSRVIKRNLNFYSYVSVGIGGLFLSTSSLLRPKIGYYIPIGITVFCTTFSMWNFYLKILESREHALFVSHVSLLQKLCSDIHRIFRCLKETEIISTGQVSKNNFGIAAYSRLPEGIGLHHSKVLDTLPSWKTLPQVRISLMNVFIVTIKLLNEACDTLRAVTATQPTINSYLPEPLEYETSLKTLEDMSNVDECIPLKSLQSVNDIYLAVQSEYLKLIALSIYNRNDINSISGLGHRKSISKIISNLQRKLSNISKKMISQFHSHNKSTFTKTRIINTKQNVNKKIHNIQVEIHNISLIVLSILLRIRSFEDFLAEVSESNAETELFKEISNQLTSLKNDLTSAVNCYDIVYSQLVTQDKVHQPKEQDIENNEDTQKQRPKKTGIVVGTSDFNVNSPDEVFLAISGDHNQEQDQFLEDWLFEAKPQIPKNLLEELNKVLKSRKLDFSEREKKALERQGLQDIQDSNDSSSSEKSCKIETKNRNSKKKRQLNYSSFSDSEDDNGLDRTKKVSYMQIPHKTLNSCSTSDSEKSISDTDSTSPKQFKNSIDNLSLANMIALKSQMWKKTEEDNYSDS